MLHVFDSVDTLFTSLADYTIQQAKAAIAKDGRFTFVLSGGSSPKRLYEMFAKDPYRTAIDWTKVFFFFGDERNVPQDHPDSNYLMAKKALFDPLNISAGQIFPINTALTPEAAANAYENDILAYFGDKPALFDLVLLGLGDNSHTASLFPYTTILAEKKALVKEVYVEEVKMFRISLTAKQINCAKQIAFLVFGAGKAEAVWHILEDEKNIEAYPAQLIKTTDNEVHWFLNKEATTRLKHH